MMRKSVISLATCALILAACTTQWPEPPSDIVEAALSGHEEWRSNRERRLVTPPSGAVLWSGLWDIPQGSTDFGSAEGLTIRMGEEDAPPLAGTLHREGQVITLHPAADSQIRHRTDDPDDEDRTIETVVTEPLVLENDRSGNTTHLALGSLALRVHSEPGTDRLWLRAVDEDHPKRDGFELPDYYPVSSEWVVPARYEPYDEPETLYFADVTGGLVTYRATGELHFPANDGEHSLIATAGERSSSFFIIMWDSTATVNTYQGGRYLRADFPDEEGWTTDQSGWTSIDFNRAYNAPCVFTAYSVCALPPRDNYVATHINAGEQRPAEPARSADELPTTN